MISYHRDMIAYHKEMNRYEIETQKDKKRYRIESFIFYPLFVAMFAMPVKAIVCVMNNSASALILL